MAAKPLTQIERRFMRRIAEMFGEVRSLESDPADQKKLMVDQTHAHMNFFDADITRAAIERYAEAVYKDLTGHLILSLRMDPPTGDPKDAAEQERFTREVHKATEHYAQGLPSDYRDKEIAKIKRYAHLRDELINLARDAHIKLPVPQTKEAVLAGRDDAAKFMAGDLKPTFSANQNDTFKKERERKLNVIASLYAIIYQKTPADQLARTVKDHFRVMANNADLADAQRQINNLTIPLHARLYSRLKKMRTELSSDTVVAEKIVVVPADARQLQKYVRKLQHALFEQPELMLKFAAYAEALQIIEKIAPELGVSLIVPKRAPTVKGPKPNGPKNRR